MKSYPITIKPFSEYAVLIEWPNTVEEAILEDILRFTKLLEEQLKGNWELVPSYNSLTLVNTYALIDFKTFHDELLGYYSSLKEGAKTECYLWTLPVCYDPEFGLDLEEVAANMDISVDELISMHSSNEYTVYGIGFLPGFMYLGGLPKALETKRRATPRLKVAKGAVGLAGKQTGIYPQESPGGWNIIGNCPIPIFNVDADQPCFVSVGDKIKFMAISRAEYELHKIKTEVGIYQPDKELLNG